MLEIVCWTKKFRWGLTNLWVPYSRKSYRFSMFEATSSNVSSWQEEPKIFENPPTLLTQRYQINGVRLLDFSLVHSTLKVHHRAKPKTFHIATLVWFMWSLFIFGFYEKKKKKACDLRPFEALITQKVQCSDLQLNLSQKWEISRRIPSHQ